MHYLVDAASWRPQYKLRAGKEEKDAVQVEYLAAVIQQTGEDWTNVDLILSTAQPMLNAAPPDLHMLEVAVMPRIGPGMPTYAGQPGYGIPQPTAGAQPPTPAGTPTTVTAGAQPTSPAWSPALANPGSSELHTQSKSLRLRPSRTTLGRMSRAAKPSLTGLRRSNRPTNS